MLEGLGIAYFDVLFDLPRVAKLNDFSVCSKTRNEFRRPLQFVDDFLVCRVLALFV